LVDLLGRGSLRVQFSGTGIIRWHSDDGREFWVWPVTYRPTEVIAANGGTGGVGQMGMTRSRDGRTEPVAIPAKDDDLLQRHRERILIEEQKMTQVAETNIAK